MYLRIYRIICYLPTTGSADLPCFPILDTPQPPIGTLQPAQVRVGAPRCAGLTAITRCNYERKAAAAELMNTYRSAVERKLVLMKEVDAAARDNRRRR
jgi:hypothetical protein